MANVRIIGFNDRTPDVRRLRLGFEGDNLVERIEFILPEIGGSRTATLMIAGADAVQLEETESGRYAVDLTAEMIGPDGEREAYIRMDGSGGEVWQSAPMRLITGALPDVEEEIEKVYPTAVGQMLTAMNEHSAEMGETLAAAEEAAKRAEEAMGRVETDIATEPEFGPELIGGNTASGTGWSGDFASGWTHTAGSTEPLTIDLGVSTAGKRYRIGFICDVSITEDNLFVGIGGSDTFDLYGRSSPVVVGVYAPEDGNLTFTPSSAFAGTIACISVREITAPIEPVWTAYDEEGNPIFQYRLQKNAVYVGENAGGYTLPDTANNLYNFALGADTLANNMAGFWDVAIGGKTLQENTTGSRNIGIGYLALNQNRTGCRNIGIGSYALNHNTDGNWNIAIGADSMDKNTSGHGNVGVGFSALYSNTTGYENVALGRGALAKASSGFHNTALGADALAEMTWHQLNTAIGRGALQKCTGSYNVALGALTGNQGTSGNRNILIGYNVQKSSPTAAQELNIGDLIKGSMASADKHVQIAGGMQIDALPTSDPGVEGRLWNEGGIVRASTENENVPYLTKDTLPAATADTLGGMKVGEGLVVDEDGTGGRGAGGRV